MIDFLPSAAMQRAKELGLDAEFTSWLSDNWLLWGEFVGLSLKVIGRGRTSWSADAICHVLRWNRVIRDQSDPTFKINNNRTSRLGRLFNACYGKPFFETRKLHYRNRELA